MYRIDQHPWVYAIGINSVLLIIFYFYWLISLQKTHQDLLAQKQKQEQVHDLTLFRTAPQLILPQGLVIALLQQFKKNNVLLHSFKQLKKNTINQNQDFKVEVSAQASYANWLNFFLSADAATIYYRVNVIHCRIIFSQDLWCQLEIKLGMRTTLSPRMSLARLPTIQPQSFCYIDQSNHALLPNRVDNFGSDLISNSVKEMHLRGVIQQGAKKVAWIEVAHRTFAVRLHEWIGVEHAEVVAIAADELQVRSKHQLWSIK